MRILESSEDYLEAMLMMQEKHGFIRSIDIAAELGVTKPSVSYATKRLRENGYITMDKDGLITLTPAGMEIASRVYDRHKTLTHFFMHLGVDEKTAQKLMGHSDITTTLRIYTHLRDEHLQVSQDIFRAFLDSK